MMFLCKTRCRMKKMMTDRGIHVQSHASTLST
uniref:Uncharacterized protein n=1 Tax=Heterorhabditis bacteriophora TaxID=37862 RepID=A0A1I7WRB2_HETBA